MARAIQYPEPSKKRPRSIRYDIRGNKPTASEGQHFRRKYDNWLPIVDLCADLTPKESKTCRDWYGAGPGFGMDAEQAFSLAKKLEWLLVSCAVAVYDKRSVDFRLCSSPESIGEFVAFLRACGGFEITEE